MEREIVRRIKLAAGGPRNLLLRSMGESLKPRWLWFGVTDRCNNRCIFCDIWRQEPTKNPLTPKEIGKAFNDDLFKGLEEVVLSGGEPVLRDDLEEIILTIHKTLPKAEIMLGTNGMLPERVIDVVESAIKHDINIRVGVSLDGIGKKRDFVRGVKGSFEKVDQLLHKLAVLRDKYKDKLDISAGFVLIDLTLPSLEEVKAYTQKLNVRLNVQWYNETLYYGNIGKNLLTNSREMTEAVRSSPPSFIRGMKLKALKGESIKFPCFAMYTFCILQPNGDVTPCLDFWDVKVGNVRETSPTLIWHSSEAKRARKMVKNCQGCLNDCGVGWSIRSCIFPALPFYIKRSLGVIK